MAEKMSPEQKARIKASRKAWKDRRNVSETKRKAAVEKQPPEEVYGLMKARKEIAERMVIDLTIDVRDLRRLSEEKEKRIDGRRGKNPFRAYSWIGARPR